MLSVISNGSEIALDDGVICTLMEINGLGIPPLSNYYTAGALQNGETYRGVLLDTRIIRAKFAIAPASFSDYFVKRSALLELFSPSAAPILRFTQPGGEKRDIPVQVNNEVSAEITADNWMRENMVIVLRAPDPTFYDPTAQSISVLGGSGTDAFEVPTAVPLEVGSDAVNLTTVINYHGTWQEFPTIRIIGPITNPIVENTTTDEQLDFTGYTIAAGHYIDIDCRWGRKTVLLNGSTNAIDKLSATSDLSTFHIAQKSYGEADKPNSIKFTGSASNTNTRLDISYLERYIGL